MAQRRYRSTQQPVAPGLDYIEEFGDKMSVLNKDPQAKQVDEITVSGSGSANETYKFELDDVVISYQNDSNPTQDELGQGLADAVNNENLINGRISASYDSGTNIITLTARLEGYGWSYTELQDPSSVLSRSNVTANATADPIPYGLGVEKHGSLGQKLGRLVDASNMTARDLQVTLDGYSAGTYSLVLEVNGETLIAESVSAGNVDDTLDELQTDIDAHELLSASVDTNPSPSELHITPETAGFADFRITGADPADTQSFTLTVDAEGDDIRDKLAGVSTVGGQELIDMDTERGHYEPNSEVDVKFNGGWVAVEVEEQPSAGDPVYLRLSTSGNQDQRGTFRASHDAGVVPLPGAKWRRAPDNDVAVLELP